METKDFPNSEFRRLVEVAKLDQDEQRIEFRATAEERQALAARFGILSVEELAGAAYVHAIGGGGARARVTFTATVVQASVVTLEPVTGRIDEAKLDVVGEQPEYEPGTPGSVTLDLTPGRYVVMCNIQGHYKAGMYADLEIVDAPAAVRSIGRVAA